MKSSNSWFKSKGFRIVVILVIVGVGLFFGIRAIQARGNGTAAAQFQTEKAARGELIATIGATGTVRSYQTANLAWQTTGTIGAINAVPGDTVQAGDVLATLQKTSLSQSIILAQSDLVRRAASIGKPEGLQQQHRPGAT